MMPSDACQKGAKVDDFMTSGLLVLIQIAVAVVASRFEYTTHISASHYGYFRDVSIMIFFGFGFLMTFLYKHGLSAIGYCLVISALVCEMSLCVEYLVNDGETTLTIENFMNGLFCSGAVMISYGAVIGKVTPLQLVVMSIVEVFGFWLNFRLAITENEAHDVGGGMVIHTFGAYFGLAVAFFVNKKAVTESDDEKSNYSSDLFSLAGTIFLWVLWPSFQSAVAGSESRQFLAMTNTFISLCSSTIAFAAVSRLLTNDKFDVVHMQNATLAGGVVMGVAGDMDMGMAVVMCAGFVAGALSCVGYTFVTPKLTALGFHDTCGVNNLHGMPGILGAIVAIIATQAFNGDLGKGDDTKAFKDVGADKQAYALLISLGVAIGTGALAGILMTKPLSILGVGVPETEYFNDRLFFTMADSVDSASDKTDPEMAMPQPTPPASAPPSSNKVAPSPPQEN